MIAAKFLMVAIPALVGLVCITKPAPKYPPMEINVMFCSQDDGSDAVKIARELCDGLGLRCQAVCANGHSLQVEVIQ